MGLPTPIRPSSVTMWPTVRRVRLRAEALSPAKGAAGQP